MYEEGSMYKFYPTHFSFSFRGAGNGILLWLLK